LDCVDKIKEYHQLVKPMFENIINNKIENQNLSEIRDSLLPKLMSGEIRV
jgi:type I restriction enzyme S subunit